MKMNMNKFLILKSLSKHINLLLIALSLSACADLGNDIEDTSRINVSGLWQYEQINWNESTQEFDSTYYNIGIEDNGNQVTLRNCLSSTDKLFNRSNELLINNDGEKLRITDSSTIESISVPDLRKLKKLNSDLSTFSNAGSITLESNSMPSINTNSNVCAQKITTVGSDKIHLRVSAPFEESYMYIDLEIEDINTPSYNISKMSFYSPSLKYFTDDQRTKMEILNGNAEIIVFTGNKIQLDYDVTIVELSIFPGAEIQGTLDLSF